jgi:nicotinamide riboside kinase
MLSESEIKRIKSIEGSVNGVVFQTDAIYITRVLGEEGISKMQEELQKFGHSLNYNQVKLSQFYPLWLRNLEFILLKDVFNWTDDDIRHMGENAPKYSFTVKLLMKYFISPQEAVKRTNVYWKRHNTVGECEISELNEKEKYILIKITGFNVTSVYCRYFEGYFTTFCRFLLSLKNDIKIYATELECISENKSSHLYKVSWS